MTVLNDLKNIYRKYLSVISPKRYLVRRFIKKNSPSRGNYIQYCVDVGAGTCPFREQLERAFSIRYYIPSDIAPNELTFVVSDAASMPYLQSSISMITAFQVVQHIPSFEAVLQEWKRILAPNGYLLITYPFMFGEADVRDFHRWTYDGMTSVLSAHGFEIIAHEKQGGAFLMLASVIAGTINGLIPGGRQTWRMSTNIWALLRIFLVTLFTFPVALLSWLGLAIDSLWRNPPFYGSGIVLTRLG